MKRILFFLVLLFPVVAPAQQFQWLQTSPIDFDMNPDYIGYVTDTDAGGNAYIAGFKENAVAYGSDILGNLYLNKYDPDGLLLFSKTLAGNATIYQVETDADGNILLVLGWMGAFSYYDDLIMTTSNQGIQPLLLKLDANGDFLWFYEPSIAGSFIEQFNALAVDGQNNVYIGYGDYGDSFVQKLSAAGALQWTIDQQQVHLISSLDIDTEGHVLVAGSCTEATSTFGGVAFGEAFSYNTYLARYDASGAVQWVKFVEDITCPFPQVRAGAPGEIFFGGELSGAFAFGALTPEGPNFGDDFFLARLDASGTFLWVRDVPGLGHVAPGRRTFLDLDGAGNVYFAGKLHDTVNWAPGLVTVGPEIGTDVAILKYAPNGDLLFAKLAGGSSDDRADAVSVAADGSVYISGIVRGSADFDGLSISGAPFETIPFMARLDPALGTGLTELPSLRWCPNPASTDVRFSGVQAVTGRIRTVLGQEVKSFSVSGGGALSVAELTAGVYVIEADGFRPGKLVKR